MSWRKNQNETLSILRMKGAIKAKQKASLMNFKALSVAKIWQKRSCAPLTINEMYFRPCHQVFKQEPVCYNFFFLMIFLHLLIYNLFKVISLLFSFKILIAFHHSNTVGTHKWGFNYILAGTVPEQFENQFFDSGLK